MYFDEDGIQLKKTKSSPNSSAHGHKKPKKRHSSNKEAAGKDSKHLKKKTTAKSGHSQPKHTAHAHRERNNSSGLQSVNLQINVQPLSQKSIKSKHGEQPGSGRKSRRKSSARIVI